MGGPVCDSHQVKILVLVKSDFMYDNFQDRMTKVEYKQQGKRL